MTDREALQIAFNALVAIDRETPYPIAKHAIKCINAVFNTQAQSEQAPIGYADKHDLEREGHDFWVSREPGKDTVPIYKGKDGG